MQHFLYYQEIKCSERDIFLGVSKSVTINCNCMALHFVCIAGRTSDYNR